MDTALAVVRAVHIGSAILVFGPFAFIACGGRPLGAARPFGSLARASLGVAVATAFLWLALELCAMSGLPMHEALGASTLSTVLGQTTFGHVCVLRLVVAAALVACLVAGRRASRRSSAWRVGAGICAALFLVGIAGWGHAMAQSGAVRFAHIAADGIHLLAAGAWIGALPPLVAFIDECLRDATPRGAAAAAAAAQRFSFLGIASSGAILLSGFVNATFTVGHVAALTGSDYGRLLLAKVALFAVILGVAAVNRGVLTPRIAHAADHAGKLRAVRQLRRNALLEMGLAFVIIAIVGRLGITMPGMGAS